LCRTSTGRLVDDLLDFCEEREFAEYMVPGFEHGIGMMGDGFRYENPILITEDGCEAV